MIYTLAGSKETKLGYHDGMFTRSYQQARAEFDAQIRNWNIEFRDNLFFVTDSDDCVDIVFYSFSIANCSCEAFLKHECGTCMHIEAVKRIGLFNKNLSNDKNIRYINYDFELKTNGSGSADTPAVPGWLIAQESKQLHEHNLTIESFDIFNGIEFFPFQKESIEKMIRHKKSVLTLQMGLGKTLCALACIRLLKPKKVIIVAPNSLKMQWKFEIDRFNIGSSVVVHKGSDLDLHRYETFLILSYEMLNSNRQLLDNHYDVLIADEIQKIKNRESVTWKTVASIQSDFVFALSGTPIQNSISDLLSLIQFLNPMEIKPEWKFYERYCNCTRSRVLGLKSGKSSELRNKFSRYIINPKIDFSSFKLPNKNESITNVKLSDQQANVHDGFFEPARKLIAKSMNYPLTFAERLSLNGLLTKARMAAIDLRLMSNDFTEKSERFVRIEECIYDIVRKNRKVVVYSEWIKCLTLLIPFLDEQNISYVMFNGQISAKKRNTVLRRFIEDKTVSVFLSTDSGGLGIDGLQFVCNDMIHIEKIWNPMKIEQRNGRLIRALQKEEVVNIYRFDSNSGIEAMMSQNHDRKYSVISDMFK